jgi:hypothetical protein
MYTNRRVLKTPFLVSHLQISSIMASSSHNINGISLATLCEWYMDRDRFFGRYFVDQNIPLALKRSSTCSHPDARWLTEGCAGKGVKTKEDAKRVFSALSEDDARALCFAWLCSDSEAQKVSASLRRSAELGYAFAQALMAGRTEGEERFKFAKLAAAQGERDGFFYLGQCFHGGNGCQQDLDKAKENYLCASELGMFLPWTSM